MKLTSKQDIEVPIDQAFAQLVNFGYFEQQMIRRGAEVERTDRLTRLAPGLTWRLRFLYRGKQRKMLIELEEVVTPSLLAYGFDSPSVEGEGRFDLVALSPTRTRLILSTDFKPKSLPARLLVQSMRLAKGRVQRRFDAAAAKLADMVVNNSRQAAR